MILNTYASHISWACHSIIHIHQVFCKQAHHMVWVHVTTWAHITIFNFFKFTDIKFHSLRSWQQCQCVCNAARQFISSYGQGDMQERSDISRLLPAHPHLISCSVWSKGLEKWWTRLSFKYHCPAAVEVPTLQIVHSLWTKSWSPDMMNTCNFHGEPKTPAEEVLHCGYYNK